jgi:hypothetical protein
VAQIGKVPDGSEENRKWNVDMEKHPAMKISFQLVGKPSEIREELALTRPD